MIFALKTTAIVFVALWGVWNYLPVGVLDYNPFPEQKEELKFGSAIQTIELSDSVKNALYTKVNANFAQTANTTTPNTYSSLQQFAYASSSLFSCYGTCYFGGTATSSFSLAGALTLITPLLPASGGTGSTTLSSNQVLLGNGTGNIGVVSGWGTSGQFLTSNGGVDAPSWQTSAIDQADNYVWTGTHDFTGNTYLKNLNASSTNIINGVTYRFPSVQGTASTSLQTDGSGNLSWGPSSRTSSGWVSQIEGNTAQLVIPHTLGQTPRQIGITATTQICNSGGTAAYPGFSFGTSTAALTANTYSNVVDTVGAEDTITASSTSVLFFRDDGNTVIAAAYVSALDATNITLNWSANSANCDTNASIPHPLRFINWTAEL